MKKFAICCVLLLAVVAVDFMLLREKPCCHVINQVVSASYPAVPSLPNLVGVMPTVPVLPSAPVREYEAEASVLPPVDFPSMGKGDVVGRLVVDGTRIDYLVTQANDNEFYLYHDIDHNPHNAGWVFLDHVNNIARPDRNTVIYGHNMMDGSRFRDMMKFRDADFFAENRYITFDTEHGNQQWEIFSFYRTHISFNYIQIIFPMQSMFGDLVDEMQARSMHDPGFRVDSSDRVITLSTCSGAGRTNYRYVLHARLIR